jgi:hypothetical protein
MLAHFWSNLGDTVRTCKTTDTIHTLNALRFALGNETEPVIF